MTSSGVPLASTAWMDGIATVNPISAIMPSTVEPATAQITPRGTLRLGLTASSDMSAASSNPTSVNAPRRPASANEYSSGLPPGLVVFPRMLNPYGDGLLCATNSANSSTPNTTVPMISVNTATLLTRAATCTLMMLTITGRIISMMATASTRWALVAGLTLNSVTRSGEAASSMIAPPPTVM